MNPRTHSLPILAVLLVGITLVPCSAAQRAAELPGELDDREFWRLATELSEPDGHFQDENYLSNERTYQRVIPRLLDAIPAGGIYLGVGPEQNFTYIAALRPKMAFIIDVRRQNMMLHLMYKALFELSVDRADFVGRLFSRERPSGLTASSSVEELFRAYESSRAERRLFENNYTAVLELLENRYGFGLSAEDRASVLKVFNAFYEEGPDIKYVFQNTPEVHATYSQMMTYTDGQGRNWSYLAAEENFQRIRQMQLRNLIVPVVGDFAGPRAIRAVGQYLRDNGARVSVFYASNVEPYLFGDGTWKAFYENVRTLPLEESSLFIRTFFGGTFRECSAIGSPIVSPALSSIPDFLKAYGSGDIRTQCDVVTRSR